MRKVVWIIPCPQCGYSLNLPDQTYLGRKAKCPRCGHKFVLRETVSPDAWSKRPLSPEATTKELPAPDGPPSNGE